MVNSRIIKLLFITIINFIIKENKTNPKVYYEESYPPVPTKRVILWRKNFAW